VFRAIRRARQALRLFFKPSLVFVKNREEESAEEPPQRPGCHLGFTVLAIPIRSAGFEPSWHSSCTKSSVGTDSRGFQRRPETEGSELGPATFAQARSVVDTDLTLIERYMAV
jgi:hypothetical protein